MSGIKGTNTQSIQKGSFPKGRNPVVGTKNIKFHHRTAAGETIIDLTSLSVSGTGLTNPSPTELAKIRLKDFSANLVEFISSAKNSLMEGTLLGYEIVDNQTIRLNFEAEENEIFTGIFSSATVNGTVIADVRTPGASGTLSEATTDFNLGEAVPIDDLTNQFPIQVYRGTDAKLMKRNTGNAVYVADPTIGNYQMIDSGDGFCQIIRFNIAGDVGGEDICWSARGALGERPNLSVLQQVDSLNGIVDLIAADALIDFGFDITEPNRYAGTAANIDLKTFGDRVLNLEKILKVEVNTNLVQTLTFVEASGTMLDTSGEFRLSGALTTGSFVGDSLLSIVDDAASTRTKFQAVTPCTVTFSADGLSTIGDRIAINKNGTGIHQGTEATAGSFLGGTTSVNLGVGDFITFGLANGSASGTWRMHIVSVGTETKRIEELI